MDKTFRESSIASIILCAGKGRRMQAPRTPKVCFPVAGRPAVLRLLETLHRAEVATNVLVVGHLAGKVVETVGPAFPGALFAFQAQLLGTGNATRQGAGVLRQLGFDGTVIVTVGDKVIEPHVIPKLKSAFFAQEADLALMVGPKGRWPAAGRVLTSQEGAVRCIVERADLAAAEKEGRSFEIEGEQLSAGQVESTAQSTNLSVYMFRAERLFEALDHLGTDNVQGEEYLTDTIAYLVDSGKRVVAVPVDDSEDVLAFNNPTELLEIEERFRRKEGLDVRGGAPLDAAVFKKPSEWAKRLATATGDTRAMLEAIYGPREGLCEEKRKRLLSTVELFLERFGDDEPVSVIRAPGRINLMGRHIDHRGGCTNLMAIDREHIAVARGRQDTVVRACNAAPASFDALEFSMDDLLRQVRLDDWRDFVDSKPVIEMVRALQGDWGNYLKAPMLRLQQKFPARQIHGVDCVVSGDIPMAAGLSSSSALVVAMAEALALTNRLDVLPQDLVDLCGEGEWFVGTRGGAADHAAVKLSQSGHIAHVSFFPFELRRFIEFPSGYSLVVCDSRLQARKAEGARQTFNERVASYELAVAWVKKRMPNYAPLIEHLRDICPENLGIRSADIYSILLNVPERIAPDALRDELGSEDFDRMTQMHTPPESYALRARLLFGIAECERSKRCLRCLDEGDMERFGWLMNVSHNGDRVEDTLHGKPYAAPSSHAYIEGLIQDLQSEDPDRVLQGQLYAQPGGYACSTPEIDRMVDIALDVQGVLGAQLSGAGLGGCMMVLIKEHAVRAYIDRINALYYEPAGLASAALPIIPIAGAGALSMP